MFLLLAPAVIVPPEKELQKQKQVAPVHDKGGTVVFFFDPAGRVRHIIIETGQRHADTDDHLGDLKDGDPYGVEPLRAHFHRHQKIVSVHRGVDAVVHNDEENAGRRRCHVGMVAVQEHRNVVVPVQEDEGLFVYDDEKCVNELGKFTENK